MAKELGPGVRVYVKWTYVPEPWLTFLIRGVGFDPRCCTGTILDGSYRDLSPITGIVRTYWEVSVDKKGSCDIWEEVLIPLDDDDSEERICENKKLEVVQ